MKGHCSSSIAAGWTYCAIAALSLLGKLPVPVKRRRPGQLWPSHESVERMLGWLVNLQTSLVQEENLSVSDTTEAVAQIDLDNGVQRTPFEATQIISPDDPLTNGVGAEPLYDELQWAGLTGRCNKVADTCYTFWAGGSLSVCLHDLYTTSMGRLNQLTSNRS